MILLVFSTMLEKEIRNLFIKQIKKVTEIFSGEKHLFTARSYSFICSMAGGFPKKSSEANWYGNVLLCVWCRESEAWWSYEHFCHFHGQPGLLALAYKHRLQSQIHNLNKLLINFQYKYVPYTVVDTFTEIVHLIHVSNLSKFCCSTWQPVINFQ